MKNRPEYAVKLFKEGYNCSQAVLAAYCDELGLDMETVLRLTSSFGGGIGRLREVCGAASSMFMLAGLKHGYTDPKDSKLKTQHYKFIQELALRFKEKNGSIICREILGIDVQHDNPTPETRTESYYKRRPCVDVVKSAAEIIDEMIDINM